MGNRKPPKATQHEDSTIGHVMIMLFPRKTTLNIHADEIRRSILPLLINAGATNRPIYF